MFLYCSGKYREKCDHTDLVMLFRSYRCDYNRRIEGIRGSQLRGFWY